MEKRAFIFDEARYSALESQRKEIQVSTQALQNQRNTRSKAIGRAKAQGEDIQPLLDEVQELGDQLKQAESKLKEIQVDLESLFLGVPNILADAVPVGQE